MNHGTSTISDSTDWTSTRSREPSPTGADAVPPADLARTIRVEQDGAVQRLLPRVVPVPALNPQQGGAVLLLYDVTDLVRLDEMRSELVAVASHELQTPSTTLRMTLLMLQEASDLLPKRQRELVATSLIGVEQLSETVHEFLDLTRIEAGELRLNLEPVHVSAVIAEALRRVEGQAKAQGISLSARVDPDLPAILADPLRLRAVFDNILSNALKYTPDGGSVTVESHRIAPSAPRRARDACRSASPTRAPAFRRRFVRGSSTSSSASNTTRPRLVRQREERASACTCAGRSSNCTAATSRAVQVPTIAGPASR